MKQSYQDYMDSLVPPEELREGLRRRALEEQAAYARRRRRTFGTLAVCLLLCVGIYGLWNSGVLSGFVMDDARTSAVEAEAHDADIAQADPNEPTSASGKATEQEPWYAAYSLETDEITIYYEVSEGYAKLHITNAEQIQKITDAVDWESWEPVTPENEYKAVPYYFLDFGNGTVISMLGDVAYGDVGSSVKIDAEDTERRIISPENAVGPFTQNDELLSAVREVVAANTSAEAE